MFILGTSSILPPRHDGADFSGSDLEETQKTIVMCLAFRPEGSSTGISISQSHRISIIFFKVFFSKQGDITTNMCGTGNQGFTPCFLIFKLNIHLFTMFLDILVSVLHSYMDANPMNWFEKTMWQWTGTKYRMFHCGPVKAGICG